jgi:xanthine dehydrogenase YagT iron-sulfur-binding subunit
MAMADGSITRRGVMVSAASGVALATTAFADDTSPTPAQGGDRQSPDKLAITLAVNNEALKLTVDPRTSLLDALREQVGLTGTKKGCDRGACGACTVHIDGRRVISCLTLAARCEGKQITTIEGLARPEGLHPVQAAFMEHDGLQCGYCTPGQIMSAVALIREGHARGDNEIREWMSGNICRCGAYPNIVAAVRQAAGEA